MIIDSHQHVMLPTSLQLQKLDEAGVDKAILFTTMPHVEKAPAATVQAISGEMQILYQLLDGQYSPDERKKHMRSTIAELKQAIAAAPERFIGFGTVPLGLSASETSQWLEQYVIQNGFCGVGEFTPGNDTQMAQLETVFAAASDHPALPLWVHTFHPVTPNSLRILIALSQAYPTVPVIFGHMGGSNWLDVIAFCKDQPQVYLDLSAAFTPLSVKTALTEVPERCLYASDAPFGEPWLSRQLIEFVSPSASVTQLALGDNIAQLLSLS